MGIPIPAKITKDATASVTTVLKGKYGIGEKKRREDESNDLYVSPTYDPEARISHKGIEAEIDDTKSVDSDNDEFESHFSLKAAINEEEAEDYEAPQEDLRKFPSKQALVMEATAAPTALTPSERAHFASPLPMLPPNYTQNLNYDIYNPYLQPFNYYAPPPPPYPFQRFAEERSFAALGETAPGQPFASPYQQTGIAGTIPQYPYARNPLRIIIY